MTGITEREYFERWLKDLECRINLRLEATEKALTIQTDETHRRLDMLNGEQARLGADRERYLQKEVYETWRGGVDRWRDEVNRTLAGYTGRDRGVSLVWAAMLAVVGLSISIAIYLK